MKKILFHYWVLLLFLLISFFLVWVWFRDDLFIGGGEEGLVLWNIKQYLSLYNGIWVERGAGLPLVLNLPKLPLLYLIGIIPSFGISWFHQFVFFYTSLLVGLAGMYKLALEITEDRMNKFLAISASVFYLFNPYSVSQVFGRFVYQGFIAWAYLPLFLYLILLWLKRGKPVVLLSLLVSLLVFSFAFAQPANIIIFWFSGFLIFIVEFVLEKPKRKDIFLRFVTIFLLWLIINFWWIYSYLKVGPSSLSGLADYQFNFSSLRGVSNYFPTREILLLRQKFLFGKDGPFFSYYSQTFTLVLSIIALAVAFGGWLRTKGKKHRYYLTTFVLVSWFISKGTNPPFGFIFYYFLFSNFPITFLLRNPYEKFGIVWLLVYSILFGIGVSYIFKKIHKKKYKITFAAFIILMSLALGEPLWKGSVFPERLRLSIPNYYSQLNETLTKDKGNGRVLITPMAYGEGVRYRWGYDGVEPSEFLINRSSISRFFYTDKRYDDKYTELFKTSVSDGKFYQLLKDLNVSYIIFNSDLVLSPEMSRDADKVKIELSRSKLLEKIGSFGPIDLYKNLDNEKESLFDVLGDKPPEIGYVKESTAKYIVNVSNSRGPYKLIFKSTFDKLWQARINGVEVENHNVALDYANSWNIDRLGDYQIDIVFKVWPWE